MDQMEQLWQYMQADLAADRMEREMKHSPARQKAEKARETFFEAQKQAKTLTDQVAAQSDRKDAIKDAIQRCRDQLTALNDRVRSNPPTELEDVRSLISEAERLRQTIVGYEQEMGRIVKQSNESNKKATGILSSAAQAKQDFDKYKKEYQSELDNENGAKKEDLEKKRTAAAELASGIPQRLLDEYQSIKKHILPPLARLQNGACSGCNTSQPSALLAKINAGNDIVECETCGRMLIK